MLEQFVHDLPREQQPVFDAACAGCGAAATKRLSLPVSGEAELRIVVPGCAECQRRFLRRRSCVVDGLLAGVFFLGLCFLLGAFIATLEFLDPEYPDANPVRVWLMALACGVLFFVGLWVNRTLVQPISISVVGGRHRYAFLDEESGTALRAQEPGYDAAMRTHGYCLYCFHQELDEHFRCLECGRFSLPAERAEYWNRHPKLIHMEQAWKSVVLFLAIAGTFATCSTMSVTAGPGSGWIILLPAAFSVGAWKTTEKYTRHLPYFDARIVWCAALVICGTVFGLLAISSGGGSRESLVWAAGFFGVGLAFAVVVSQICLRYENWKHAVMRGERRP